MKAAWEPQLLAPHSVPPFHWWFVLTAITVNDWINTIQRMFNVSVVLSSIKGSGGWIRPTNPVEVNTVSHIFWCWFSKWYPSMRVVIDILTSYLRFRSCLRHAARRGKYLVSDYNPMTRVLHGTPPSPVRPRSTSARKALGRSPTRSPG